MTLPTNPPFLPFLPNVEGFEDTLMIRRGVLAESNRQLVEKTADLCAKYDRPIATPAQARHILGLDPR